MSNIPVVFSVKKYFTHYKFGSLCARKFVEKLQNNC